MTLQGYAAEAAWIRERFDAEWDDRTPVEWDNIEFEKPADGSPYVQVTIHGDGASQPELGESPTYRHEGSVIVQVFTAALRGEGENTELCDEVAKVFRGARGPGIRFQTPQKLRIGKTEGWFKQDVLCPFTRDTIFT